MKNLSNSFWVIVILGVIFWFFIGRSHDSWMGFYYPGGNIAGSAVYSPNFTNKEACISWGENERILRPQDSSIDPQNLYECGKNCKIENDRLGLHVCDQTFDGGDWRRGDYGN